METLNERLASDRLMVEPETHQFPTDAGAGVPNSRLPVLLYRRAMPTDADAIERGFAKNGWTGGWRAGLFDYHHFHTTAHEVLGIASGRARIRLGGPDGKSVEVAAGDVIVLPAGVAHCREDASPDLVVVGAYPRSAPYDTRRPDPAELVEYQRNVSRVPVPEQDPVGGADNWLVRLWIAE